MIVAQLLPSPGKREVFRRSEQRFVPRAAGCYVLATFGGDILYIGLTVDLRRRMGEHLDTPAKVALTGAGRATWLYWLETRDLNKVERTWLNIHLLAEGRLPILNSVYSPTSA